MLRKKYGRMQNLKSIWSKSNNEATDNVQTEVEHEVRRVELKGQMRHF
jgi:hypothetical protein